MKEQSIYKFLIFLIYLVPSITCLYLLIVFYPATGLGRVITIPITVLSNCIIISLRKSWQNGLRIKQIHINHRVITALLTLIITVLFYPQDYGPHVIVKITQSIFS